MGHHRFVTQTLSAPIVGVDLNIIGAEVTGGHRAGSRTHAQVESEAVLRAFHHLMGPSFGLDAHPCALAKETYLSDTQGH